MTLLVDADGAGAFVDGDADASRRVDACILALEARLRTALERLDAAVEHTPTAADVLRDERRECAHILADLGALRELNLALFGG